MKRAIIVLGLVFVLAAAGAPAGDSAEAEQEKRNKARKLAGSVVITNDVLQQLYGPAPDRPVPPVVAVDAAFIPLPDPLEAMEIEAGVARNRRDQAVVTGKRIAELEQRLKELESRKLAVLNPYLRRPVLTEEEAAAWVGLDNRERVLHTEEAMAKTRGDLEAARLRLAELQRGN
jgi:hypothetical protein